ncbi:MAG: hypothetical protein IOC63_16950 [Methylobacterium sp.]|nr:hypothetical protein [Methylobacterium sp.]
MIRQGQARDPGRKIWEIIDAEGVVVTRFNTNHFNHIFPNAEVYFIDFDIDPNFCDNVQSKIQVDRLVRSATPAGGIDPDAEAALRLFIMGTLLSALNLQGQAQITYVLNLSAKMQQLAAQAQQGRVTIAYLQGCGIA